MLEHYAGFSSIAAHCLTSAFSLSSSIFCCLIHYFAAAQAAQMAFPVVNEENVYMCTGNPLPADVRLILDELLNKRFQEAFSSIFCLLLLPPFFFLLLPLRLLVSLLGNHPIAEARLHLL